MQNNGLVKLFAVLFVLVSIYQLSFTFSVNRNEDKARAYALEKIDEDSTNYFDALNAAELQYLDSVSTDKHFGYANAKMRELNKGLDLKGGINVILQISVKDILKGLAENTRSPLFNQSLTQADELQKSSDDSYVEIIQPIDRHGNTIPAPMWKERLILIDPDFFNEYAPSHRISLNLPVGWTYTAFLWMKC